MEIKSSAFGSGGMIPAKYTCDGADFSPPLEWMKSPAGTKSFALICDDPDAPTPEPWVHWVICKIPPETTGLPEGVPRTPRLKQPEGAVQGKNSWPAGETIGFRGPMPPPGHGTHHYHFKLFALRAKLAAEPGMTKKQLLAAMSGQIVEEAELMGTYER